MHKLFLCVRFFENRIQISIQSMETKYFLVEGSVQKAEANVKLLTVSLVMHLNHNITCKCK